MSDCIFCKLANGEIPTRKIYEDDLFTVFMDAGPVTRGHSLIVPKRHADNLYSLPDEEASKIMILAKKLATHMTEKLHADGFNIMQNNGEVAGQSVFHYHLHLIPRYKNDGHEGRVSWPTLSLSDEELDSIRDLLKEK
ncbi:MAG: HIT family protein [Lachnospiraceae bacterium]|jgi:histidine triad (HIT) family protein|nr:HIT family protein [Lachnospiraceae bacterium]